MARAPTETFLWPPTLGGRVLTASHRRSSAPGTSYHRPPLYPGAGGPRMESSCWWKHPLATVSKVSRAGTYLLTEMRALGEEFLRSSVGELVIMLIP